MEKEAPVSTQQFPFHPDLRLMNSIPDISHKLSTLEKARSINLSRAIYGTFAEIGAGQEVANWFFRAGGASGTLAKTMSAYDKTFSDEIYGKAQRYVSRDRLETMLNHEYQILLERLAVQRGAETCFFVLADTVRARTFKDTCEECHGWMGLRFQAEPGQAPSEVRLHVRLLDDAHHLQAEALGVLGVNLLYGAFHLRDNLPLFLSSLMDDLNRWRVEFDVVKFRGPAFPRKDFEDRLCALQLVRSGLGDAVLFGANGEIHLPTDILYNRPVLLMRGSFDPVTRVHLDMLQQGEKSFLGDFGKDAEGHVEILEITMHNLLGGPTGDQHFLARADVLQALGKNVLVSRYAEFHRVSTYLARHTKAPVGIVLGLPLFEELFEEKWYADLAGGLLEAFGRLFKNRSRLYVYPSGDAQTGKVRTAEEVKVTPEQQHLLAYLLATRGVRPIKEGLGCEIFETTADVRKMIEVGDERWRTLVPDIVLKRDPLVAGEVK
jgi:hypothetical protein